MALADRLDEAPRRQTGFACSVGALEEKLAGTEEGEALRRMMYELGWSGNRIYQAVIAEGHVIGNQTVNRHRSKSCGCFKATS